MLLAIVCLFPSSFPSVSSSLSSSPGNHQWPRFPACLLALLCQGLLDDQFLELQQLQDESSPDFVEEVVLLFIQDSGRIIQNLTDSL